MLTAKEIQAIQSADDLMINTGCGAVAFTSRRKR